jgi:hypothetical protein
LGAELVDTPKVPTGQLQRQTPFLSMNPALQRIITEKTTTTTTKKKQYKEGNYTLEKARKTRL